METPCSDSRFRSGREGSKQHCRSTELSGSRAGQLRPEKQMDEYQDQEDVGLSAKTGYGAGVLVGIALAATLALCGWNVRWSSSGPTSVTIIGINGPNSTIPTERADRATVLVPREFADGG